MSRRMTESRERVCVGCGNTDEMARLEPCTICNGFFCADCAYRAGYGRRFCSPECARAYYFTGESDDDDENAESDD